MCYILSKQICKDEHLLDKETDSTYLFNNKILNLLNVRYEHNYARLFIGGKTTL
jgi:hypothetical protein